jgi:hypothetical protein
MSYVQRMNSSIDVVALQQHERLNELQTLDRDEKMAMQEQKKENEQVSPESRCSGSSSSTPFDVDTSTGITPFLLAIKCRSKFKSVQYLLQHLLRHLST